MISVVLPVFNGEHYLAESLSSVLCQVDADFEVVACDDGSSDRSKDILAEYQHDARVRVIAHEHNQGLFPTLNELIRTARGTHIRLWAQDDRMKPNCLAVESAFWRRHPDLAMTYCGRDLIDANGNIMRHASTDPTPDIIEPWLATQISFYWGSMPGNIANVTIRRDVFDDVGWFREDMRVSADFDMWTRISEKYSIGFIRDSLMELRVHNAQFSRWQDVGLDFIREDREIVRRLIERLPPELRPHARSYNLRHRAVRQFHHAFRRALGGTFRHSLAVCREIQRDYSLLLVGLMWLLTGNGRWWRPQVRYVAPRDN